MGFNNGNSSFGFGGSSSGGGGGGGISFVTTCNNATFSLYGNGTAGSPLNGCPILSACSGNALSVCPDGLYATDNNSAVIVLGSGSFSSVRCGVNNTASGNYSGAFGGQCNQATSSYGIVGGGFQNRANGNRSAILGGQLNDTCGFADAQILGSCICASQVCTTFVNCLSASNIPSGCAVCSTTNNVLVGFTTPNYNIGFFTQTANSTPISGTTTETTLINGGVGSLTVPSNTFKVGDSFVAIMGGVINTDNNQTIRIRVKVGSVILADSGVQSITNIVNDVFSLNVNFTIRQIGATTVASIVTLGTFVYHKTSNTNVSSFAFNTVNSTTFDTTISNTLDITVEWGSASVVNSIFSDIFTLNKTY